MALIFYRKNIFPKSFLDFLPCAFLLTIIPITYWFEVWVALPSLFPFQSSTTSYCTLFIIGHFLLINVLGNLFGVIAVDTSIRGRMMPSMSSPEAAGYCDECKSVTPPRSYHCPTCRTCILRRDHHCMFTACCIGHYNYRYFLMFLLHLFVSTAFCLPFNIIFLWDYLTWSNAFIVPKLLFPVIMFITGANFTKEQGYLMVCFISLAGMMFVGLWFYFHLRLAMRGRLVHEMRKDISLYDKGLKENLREILGERWYLVWTSPFMKSELTCDGINFLSKVHSS